MYRQARDLAAVHHQLFGHCLLDKIVDSNRSLGGHEKVSPRRMELDALDDILGLFEWNLHLRQIIMCALQYCQCLT